MSKPSNTELILKSLRFLINCEQKRQHEKDPDDNFEATLLGEELDEAIFVSMQERTPHADGVWIKDTEGDDRCPHGMFRSGAGACPLCGGGVEL